MIIDFPFRPVEPDPRTPGLRREDLEDIIDQLETRLMAVERRQGAARRRWERICEYLPFAMWLGASFLWLN